MSLIDWRVLCISKIFLCLPACICLKQCALPVYDDARWPIVNINRVHHINDIFSCFGEGVTHLKDPLKVLLPPITAGWELHSVLGPL